MAAGDDARMRGVVFTQRWAVNLLLDLAGYVPDEESIIDKKAVDPSCGDGAFACIMAQRLVSSCMKHGRPVSDCARSLVAIDIDAARVANTRSTVTDHLTAVGVPRDVATSLAEGWVRVGDYLSPAPGRGRVDFVVGNPPYVRMENIDPTCAVRYRETYPTMQGRADLYVAFFEAAIHSLRPEGVCAFLCADRWMHNSFGATLRDLITRECSVSTIIEMHSAKAFERDVCGYASMTAFRKTRERPPTLACRFTGTGEVTLSDLRADSSVVGITCARVSPWFAGEEPWPCCSPAVLSLVRRIEGGFPLIESRVGGTKMGIGVATGADKVYVVDARMPPKVESRCLLSLAMASDDREESSRQIISTRHALVNPWPALEAEDRDAFPLVREYFRSHETQIRARYVGKKDPARWYRTIDRINDDLIGRKKLYIPDISIRLSPVLDEGGTYPHHNLYWITSSEWDLEVLGGILMSDIVHMFAECYAMSMRGGYRRFQTQFLRRIRVPRAASISEADQLALRTAFRKRDVVLSSMTCMRLFGVTELPR
jgi:adenine-specific DNA-methyltransferase